jgi:ribosome-binding factor A
MEVEVLDAELIKVTITRDGFTASCYVTSHHLVEDKRRQLEAAINREAARAFNP